MKSIATLTFVTAILAAPFSLYAATNSAAPAVTASSSAASSADKTTEGEIRKVDKDAKKITIRHSELKHLEMPAMTMVFQVKDLSLLNKVKQGDKVSFVAEKEGGQFIVTQIDAKQKQ